MRTIALLCMVVIAACAQDREFERQGQEIINGQNCHWQGDTCVCVGSPIIIDTAGDGYALTGYQNGVPFALKSGGHTRIWSWTNGSDDAWLALPGFNGVVDDGGELFGDNTLQPISQERNGFTALRTYDSNGDHVIDYNDPVYSELRLWFDRAPRDGVSQRGELITMESAGIRSLSTEHTASQLTDSYGNEFRYAASIVADAPVAAVAHDVFLLSVALSDDTGPIEEGGGITQDYTEWTCTAWWYAITAAADCHLHPRGCQACDNVYVQTDPFATAGDGRLARLVSRFKISTVSLSDAMNRAREIVSHATWGLGAGSAERCVGWHFPNPDTFRPAPYDDGGDLMIPRVKCTSRVVSTGGGGGGTGGGCT